MRIAPRVYTAQTDIDRLQALIFDSWFDSYRGVGVLTRVFQGMLLFFLLVSGGICAAAAGRRRAASGCACSPRT